MDIENRVFLLAILKKQENETLNDVLLQLVNNRLFTIKEGKKRLKELKAKEFIIDGKLSVTGQLEAKKAEDEFKI